MRSEAEPIELIYSLVGYPSETEWLEFKVDNADPANIGKDISALANAAAYHGRDIAYKIWGVDDTSKQLVGTNFNPLQTKAKGNQDLPIWLKRMLSSNANYEFSQFTKDSKHFVVLSIYAPSDQPVYFENVAYIREGSSTTKLKSGSAKEAELWRRLQKSDFEKKLAAGDFLQNEIPEYLNIDAYFSLLGMKQPTSLDAAMGPLIEQAIIKAQANGRYSITNLGALLIGRKISAFAGLRKRALRIVRFEGDANFNILEDQVFDEGYALALPNAQNYLMALIPSKEEQDGAFRRIAYAYPQRAVRELLVNAVIHQDLSVAESGPMVSVFDGRIEFSNPGASLIPSDRVLNAQPKTRNDALTALLRQMGLCEESGTGWDLAVDACERACMLPPRIVSTEDLGTQVTLFLDSDFSRMKKSSRIDAVYWHACLMYASGGSMSNQTLRARFGLGDQRKDTLAMSRLIRECCDKQLIKEEDESASAKYKRYIPFWA